MNNSKVYSILVTFDKYEQNRFRKFLHSPYFNQNEKLTALFEIMTRHILKKADKDLDKEKTWKRLHPEKKFNDIRFRKYLSELLKLAERYLAMQVYEQNPIEEALYLIEAVNERKLKKLHNSSMRSARLLSQKQLHNPAQFYYRQYLIEKKYYELAKFDIKRTDETNEKEINVNLDHFYLAEKMRLYCSILSRKFVSASDYKPLFIDQIIEQIEEKEFEDIPAISIYYQIYLTQTQPEIEDHYYKLKELLEEHNSLFSPSQAYEMYSNALNYSIRNLNRGNQKFLEEIFYLYNELIDKRLIFSEEGLSPWKFKNITVSALRLGKFDWTFNFIENYAKFIPENSRENAVTYNLANLYFYQKKYDKVIEKLRDVEFEDFTYNLNSKTMLIATYYETDEIEPLYSLFESFRTYLNRHKEIPESRRKIYLNLIKFTKRLTKIMPGDKKSLQKLKEDIENTKSTVNANWLKEKIADLE